MSLSTRVLDTSRGVPAAGLPVRLDAYDGTTWGQVAEGVTGRDGRLELDAGAGGVHRLRYGTEPYFEGATRFPEIQVIVSLVEGPPVEVLLQVGPHAYTAAVGAP